MEKLHKTISKKEGQTRCQKIQGQKDGVTQG
jgi:hypothetical protein